MPSLDRTQHLLDALSAGARPTQRELSEALGCTKRQVRRLLRQLRADGMPIREVREGHAKRYFLQAEDQHHALRTVRLTERQLQALTAAIEAARAVLRPTPFAAPLQAAAATLADEWLVGALTFESETEAEHWSFGDEPEQRIDDRVFWTLLDAMRARQSVRVDYFTASRRELTKGRKLDPYLFAVRRGSWMVVAYCHRSSRVKDFAVQGIRRIAWCDPAEEQAIFRWHADFDPQAHFAGRFASVSGDALQAVRLLVESDRAPYFRRKQYHASQQIEAERPDGRLVVRYAVRGLEELRAFVLSWGAGVHVLEPEALAREVQQIACATLMRYRTEEEPGGAVGAASDDSEGSHA